MMKMNGKANLGSFKDKNPFSNTTCSTKDSVNQVNDKLIRKRNNLEEFNIPSIQNLSGSPIFKKYLHSETKSVTLPTCNGSKSGRKT